MQPDKIFEEFAKFIRQNAVVFLLVLFLVVDMAFLPFIFSGSNNSGSLVQTKTIVKNDSLKNADTKNVVKISDITGSRIDAAPAVIERLAVVCQSLPVGIWIFLLIAYVALLIFNLSFDFYRATKVQWRWELLLTFLALLAWYLFDECRTNIWYPLFVLKMGILIFATYLYFFDRKQKTAPYLSQK